MFGEGGWMGAGMWLIWILLIVITVFLVKALVRGASSSRSGDGQSPLEILKTRYARGEIDEDEFERRRRELEK